MKSFHSLRTLFLWPLVTLTICALGLSSLGIYYLASAKIENELALRGTIMTNSIEAALETHRSPSDFDRFMLAIGGEADINDVYIVDENFHAITPRGTAYTSDESSVAIQQLLQLALTSKITQTARYQRNQFLIAKPILLTSSSAIPAFNTSRGVIFMNLSTTSSQHLAFYTALALTAFLTLISVITQFMVFRLVKTWVLVPSQKIVKTIALQKNGNNAQTQLQPINEIGLIGKTLDDLFIELHQREQTLLEKAFQNSITEYGNDLSGKPWEGGILSTYKNLDHARFKALKAKYFPPTEKK